MYVCTFKTKQQQEINEARILPSTRLYNTALTVNIHNFFFFPCACEFAINIKFLFIARQSRLRDIIRCVTLRPITQSDRDAIRVVFPPRFSGITAGVKANTKDDTRSRLAVNYAGQLRNQLRLANNKFQMRRERQ